VEAIILAGGKAERLGDASEGRPKSLVPVGGKPLVAYQVLRLHAAGVERVIVSCAAGKGRLFVEELGGLGAKIVVAEEPKRLGRGGGIRFAAKQRRERGDIYVLNGDELLDVDFVALRTHHERGAAAATITVARPPSPFGLVDLGEDDLVTGFREIGRVPYWVNCGVYVFGEEALERLPERGDHEATTFPELVSEGRLRAYRHEGLWLTVNTPKDLRRAEEQLESDPGWLSPPLR
jgi:NDP-sugar pyrophosphorylase family protein